MNRDMGCSPPHCMEGLSQSTAFVDINLSKVRLGNVSGRGCAGATYKKGSTSQHNVSDETQKKLSTGSRNADSHITFIAPHFHQGMSVSIVLTPLVTMELSEGEQVCMK